MPIEEGGGFIYPVIFVIALKSNHSRVVVWKSYDFFDLEWDGANKFDLEQTSLGFIIFPIWKWLVLELVAGLSTI